MHMENKQQLPTILSKAINLKRQEIWIPLRRICPPRDEFECQETNLNTPRGQRQRERAKGVTFAAGTGIHCVVRWRRNLTQLALNLKLPSCLISPSVFGRRNYQAEGQERVTHAAVVIADWLTQRINYHSWHLTYTVGPSASSCRFFTRKNLTNGLQYSCNQAVSTIKQHSLRTILMPSYHLQGVSRQRGTFP
jgi:hypothetical protein